MAEDLFLRVHEDLIEWLVLDRAAGIVRFRGDGDLGQFQELTRDMSWSGRTHVMIPAESALLTSASVPSRQQRQILQAVPYVIEERIADDIDDCHFAVGPRDEDGNVSVAVVDRARFERMLERLESAELHPSTVTIDALHVPLTAKTSIQIDGDRALIRTGTTRAMAIELDVLPVTIGLLDAQRRSQISIGVHGDEKERFQLYQTQIEADAEGEIEVFELEDTPFEHLCRAFDPDSIDLLQGDFKLEEEYENGRDRWRAVAMLAGFAFALHVMLVIGQGIYLDVKATQYEAQARALYADVFPQDSNVRDIRRRWQSHLGAVSGEPSGKFFELFGQTAQHIPGSRLTLENVNFNEGRGDLILQMISPGSDQFVLFAQTLAQAGLDAEVGTISQDGEAARGSIKIKAFGSN